VSSSRTIHVPLIAIAAVAIATAACTDLATQPSPALVVSHPLASVSGTSDSTVHLLSCPSTQTYRSLAVIGPWGGQLSASGVTVRIPPGAVSQTRMFEIVVPASTLMETEIHALGEQHFVFNRPITITISFSRCPSSTIPDGETLQGAYFDASTYQVLQLMGGVYDVAERKVTFNTDHLSGYVVAY
jgi:hypothetical protein